MIQFARWNRGDGVSVRAQLIAFTLVLALPILCFVALLLFQLAGSQRVQVEAAALDKARNMAIAIDRELGGLTATLNVLATAPTLRAGDFEGFYRQAAAVRGAVGYWVILREHATGQQVLNTSLPWGSPLPKSNMPSPDNAQLRAGQPFVSNLVRGAVTGTPVFAVQMSVEANGTQYILSLPVPAKAMRDVLVSEKPPEGWTAAIVDGPGSVLARNVDFEGSVGQPGVMANVPDRGEGTTRTSLDRGVLTFVAFAGSHLSEWRLELTIPEAVLRAPLRRSLLWLAVLGLSALALSLILARAVSRRISGPIAALAEQAAALGRGEAPVAVASPLREVARVSRTLAHAAEALRAREQGKVRLAAIVSSSNDAIVSFDPADGTVLTWNRYAEVLFGYTEAEALGRTQAMLLPPELPEGPGGLFARAMAGQQVQQHETIRLAKDGRRIDVAVTVARMVADDGHVIGVSAIYHDIRERKRAEAALQEAVIDLRRSEARYRLVVESATDFAIVTTDMAGVITGWYTGAENLLGWSRDEAIGRPAAMFFTDEDQAVGVPEAEMGTALAKGRAPDERWHRRMDGSRFFAIGALLPKRDEAGTLLGFLKILRDRTDEFELQEQRRSLNETLKRLVDERTQALAQSNEQLVAEMAQRQQAEEQLRQAQKMEAVGRLTGGIAHDFNNLLTIITGSLDMLRRRVDLSAGDQRVPRLIDQAIEGANRAAALTYRLLAFSRQHPLAPEPVDANKLVAGISDLVRRTLGEHIAVETVLAGGLWRTHADANQLENALLNLAVNARDAMPDGGKLTIETGNTHLDEAYAASRPEVTAGQYVLIAVCDTGAGMTAEVLERVFEPFFTTKPVGKGTGLGLSQVYGFMKQSGGHIAVYSEPGYGTTMKLYLPRFRQADEVRGVAPDRSVVIDLLAPARAGETVLVVEDEPLVRAFSVAALEEAGYGVLSAEDGPSGLALLDAHPEVALLFTDVVLTGPLNGRKVADEALRRRPDLKVVFTTGYTRNAIIHHGRLDEDVELITKPFTAAVLTGKLRAVLDQDRTTRL